MQALKFGGSSVGNAERMRSAVDIIARRAAEGPLLVVVSAVGGVTDTLLRGAELSASGGSVVPPLARFHSVHREILDNLRAELGAGVTAEAEADLGALEERVGDAAHGRDHHHERTLGGLLADDLGHAPHPLRIAYRSATKL